MTYEKLMFYLFAMSAVGGAFGVVLSQRVARMAFWLIVSLASTAGLYFLLNADFVGATQVIIYVGGTLVLLIFGIMLTASGPHLKVTSTAGEVVQGGTVGFLLLFVIVGTVLSVNWGQAIAVTGGPGFQGNTGAGYNPVGEGNTVRPIGMALLGMRPDKDLGAAEDAGLSSGYLFPFEIVSVHLLVVLVGAAYLARAKHRVRRQPSEQ